MRSKRRNPYRGVLLIVAAMAHWLAATGTADESGSRSLVQKQASQILQAAGIQGGLIVHLGCGDGRLTAALQAGEGYLVQGWDADADHVAAARDYLLEQGQYGPVSVERRPGAVLPYIDNLVNLLVVTGPAPVDRDEMLRVLAPGGRAVVMTGGDQQRTLEQFVKPRPASIDEWTHYLRDASGNAVADDTEIGPLRRMQWVGGPRYSRHHDRLSSVSAVVSAGGRVFYIFDEASARSVLLPPQWRLIARDAFNGTVLWKQEIPQWHTHLWPLKSGPAQLPRRLVASGDRVYVTLGINAPVVALDAATGETVHTYAGTAGTEEILLDGGVLCLLVDEQLAEKADDGLDRIQGASHARFWDERPRQLVAFDAPSGDLLWRATWRVLAGTPAATGGRIVFHDGESIVSLDQKSGRQQWRSEPVARCEEIRSFYVPTLVLYEDVVLFSGGETAGKQTGSWYRDGDDKLTALAAEDGRVLWEAHHPPSGYRSPEDVLVVDGLVWTGETTSGRAEGLFTGRDVHTGEVRREFLPDVSTYWFHHRCHRGKATSQYLLMSRTGIEMVDVRQQSWEPHHWVRGACLYGIMPANGLIYSFEEGAKDASGHSNDGEVEGAEAVEGQVGRALKFVGGPPRVRGYDVALHWTEDLPLWARALVLADDVLFVAGPPDLIDEEQAFREIRLPATQQQLAEQAASFAGRRGGLLQAVSATSGRKLAELPLESPPVFDGMAAAHGRLYLATESGHVTCFAER